MLFERPPKLRSLWSDQPAQSRGHLDLMKIYQKKKNVFSSFPKKKKIFKIKKFKAWNSILLFKLNSV